MTRKTTSKNTTKNEKSVSANSLTNDDLKDLLLVTSYKLAMTRAQLEALGEILIKKKLMTYEEYWKLTNEKFRSVKV